MASAIAILRVASLSVREAERYAFGADRLDDSVVAQAIGLAAGPELLSLADTHARARDAVARYARRMGGRATPFGLLAGTALVETGPRRDLAVAGRPAHHCFVRLDTGALHTVLATHGIHRATLLAPGTEPAVLAVEALRAGGQHAAAEALTELSAAVCGIRPIAELSTAELNREWAAAAVRIPALAVIPEHHRFHIDLDLALTAAKFEHNLADELDATLRRIQLLFAENDPLAGFTAAFRARYEDAEVPLADVLRFGNGLLETTFTMSSPLADTAGSPTAGAAPDPPDRHVPDAALRALDHFATTGQPYDIAALPAAEAGISGSVQAALLDNHEGRHTAQLIAGQTRAPLAFLSRFALARPDRETALRAWQAAGKDPDAGDLEVELLHSPGGRMGNVLLRPRLHAEAIALPGATGGTITFDRLLVRHAGGRLHLRDAHTGRPVRLRLNTAHAVNHPRTDPVYRVLAQLAGTGSVKWRWGALAGLAHLPRITCGSIIVAPERWRVPGARVDAALAAGEPERALRELLPGLGELTWVGCGPAGKPVPIDLSSPASIRLARRQLARRAWVDFTELPQLASPAVHGPGGRHVAEVYIPLRTIAIRPPARPGWPAPDATDWVYARYFCGVAAADEVVCQAHRAAGELRAAGRVSGWFFVRYGDGGHHLRVRMLPARPADRPTVLAEVDALGRRLRAAGLVVRTELADYVPEIGRYGGPAGLARAESLFCADSDTVADFLTERPDERTRLWRAVADTLSWAGEFCADDTELLRTLRAGSGSPPAGFGRFHRRHRDELDKYLANADPDPVLSRHIRALRRTVADRDDAPAVLRAVLHMHDNRLFALDARRLERLACHLAVRKTLERRGRAAQLDSTGK